MKNDRIEIAMYEWQGNRYVRISPWYTGLKTSAVHDNVPTHYIGRYIWCGW